MASRVYDMRPATYDRIKRGVDVALACAVAGVAAPVMLTVAAAVRLRLGSPVLFHHARPGFHGRVFHCLKFRTMTNARDGNGKLLRDEQRLTPFGMFLRRYSLDELPQLWNVLTGDMSLVGPRPLEVRYLGRYTPDQDRRHLVKPGVTGWAQVNGRNAIDWDEKLALDMWYVDHRGLWLDFRILALTIRKVVSGDGISKAGHATMPEFLGTLARKQY